MSIGWTAYLASWIPLTDQGFDAFWSKWRITHGYMALVFALDGITKAIPLAISFVGNLVMLYSPLPYMASMRGRKRLWVPYLLLLLTPVNVAAPFLWFKLEIAKFGMWPWLLGVSFPCVAAGFLVSARTSAELSASSS